MLVIWKMSFHGLDYYLNSEVEDFYSTAGEFDGCKAKGLGLSGIVKREQLRALLQEVEPVTRKQLMQNTKTPCGCPKHRVLTSVNLARVFREFQRIVQDIEERTVQAVLNYAETHFDFRLVGSVRKDEWSTKPPRQVVTTFEHAQSRILDPKSLSHICVFNVDIVENRDAGIHRGQPFYKNRDILEAYYRSQLAYLVNKEFGLESVRKVDSLRLKDFLRWQIRFYPRGCGKIERLLIRNGRSGWKAWTEPARKIRPTRKSVPVRAKRLRCWQQVILLGGFRSQSIRRLSDSPLRNPEQDLPKALAQAVANLSHRNNHFSERDLLVETLREAVHYAIPPHVAIPAVQEYLQCDEGIRRLGTVHGVMRYTTQEPLKCYPFGK